MMTQELEVSILAAPLAAIDRRVLSQAWYSALRLENARHTSATTLVRRNARGSRGSLGRPVTLCATRACFAPPSARLFSRVGAASPAGAGEGVARLRRASLRAPLARAIANAFAGPQPSLRRATFSLGRGSARIHVVLQTKGQRATLVALCSPELRIVVAHALAQARRALKARGIGVDFRAKGEPACF